MVLNGPDAADFNRARQPIKVDSPFTFNEVSYHDFDVGQDPFECRHLVRRTVGQLLNGVKSECIT
jgi:hypothetical protein